MKLPLRFSVLVPRIFHQKITEIRLLFLSEIINIFFEREALLMRFQKSFIRNSTLSFGVAK